MLEIQGLQQVVAGMRLELRGALERETAARHLALHDDLTALPNRRFFHEQLTRALAEPGAGHLAVIFLDLDGFKALNDQYGHDVGDTLLSLVGARLTHSVRTQDLVSRLGGDEYACLITGGCNQERLQQLVETLFDAVSHPFTIGTLRLTVRPSIGIAVSPRDGTTAASLLKVADQAMYRAKQLKLTYAFSG